MLQRSNILARSLSSSDVGAGILSGHNTPTKPGRGGRGGSCSSRPSGARAASRLPVQCLCLRLWLPRPLVPRLRLASLALIAVLCTIWLATGGLWVIVDWVAANIRAKCPAYGPDRAAAEGALLASAGAAYTVDSEGCVSFCPAAAADTRNGSECGPSSTFCGLYVVKVNGRAGNAFIQVAVGRLLARRRRAAFIAPPVIEGFGALPAAFQASCPAAGFGAWPWLWHAPWATQVCSIEEGCAGVSSLLNPHPSLHADHRHGARRRR